MSSNDFSWNFIKKYYNEKFGIRYDLVDAVADYFILSMSMFGFSNTSISQETGLSVEEVKKILKYRLNFEGFDKDTEFGLMEILSSDNDSIDRLQKEGLSLDDANTIKNAYDLYTSLLDEIEKSWK